MFTDPTLALIAEHIRATRKPVAGYIYTRQDLSNHDPADPKPYPVVVTWFPTREEAVAWAERGRREHFPNDPKQLICVRPAEGWSLVIVDPDEPEGVKPNYLTYRERTQAEGMRARILRSNPRLQIRIKPYVSPERKPARAIRQDAAA